MADRDDVVRAVLVPLVHEALLVPTAVVAEVAPYAGPLAMPGVPAWVLGSVDWRGRSIPVVSMDVAMGGAAGVVAGQRTRIAVLRTLDAHPEMPLYGLLASGTPRVLQASAESLHRVEAGAGMPPFVLERVTVAGTETALIPDLDSLQTSLLELGEQEALGLKGLIAAEILRRIDETQLALIL